jgi:hypothetical protein
MEEAEKEFELFHYLGSYMSTARIFLDTWIESKLEVLWYSLVNDVIFYKMFHNFGCTW